MAPRVLVTGLGVVSPIGVGVDDYWHGLLHADSRPEEDISLPPGSMAQRRTYRVRDRSPARPVRPGWRGGTATGFAVRAAEMAMADAGLLGHVDGRSVIGTSIGNAMGDDVFEVERMGGPPAEGLDAFFFEVAAATGAALDLHGPSLGVSTACSAGLYSISLAVEMIQSGQADVFVAGGAEAVCRVAMGCFNRLSAIDPVACRPFDADRRGTVMGEGAAILVLESEEHLRRRRGSRVYGQIEGAGWSCDGHHTTIPEPSGKHALAAARRALAEASLDAGAIGCVLAHGTGTTQNDQMESLMLRELFGERADEVWVCGVKGKLGHGGGAAGAFQCLTAALVLDRGIVPPTGNVSSVDPSCRVRLDRGHGQAARVEHVLMNSYAFGGNNISLIMGRASVDI